MNRGSALAALLLLTATTSLALSQETEQRLCILGIEGEEVSVHVGPRAETRLIASLPVGACDVMVTDEMRGDWVLARRGDVIGWIERRHFDPNAVTHRVAAAGSQSADGPVLVVATVSGGALNVRGGPSSRNPVVARVMDGDALADLGEKRGRWHRVRVGQTEGWVFDRYVRPAGR